MKALLVGDIGGTNARFSILVDEDAEPIRFPNVQTADYGTIDEAGGEEVGLTYGLFAAINIFAVTWYYLRVPETRKFTLERIEWEFREAGGVIRLR